MPEPLSAGLLATYAEAVGIRPHERLVPLLDDADLQARPDFAEPDGDRLVTLPPYDPGPHPAEALWLPVDEPMISSRPPWMIYRTSSARDAAASLGSVHGGGGDLEVEGGGRSSAHSGARRPPG